MSNNNFLEIIPLFSTPIGYINFGEQSRNLNQQLIVEIEQEMQTHKTARRSFSGNDSAWQSESGLENKYSGFGKLQEIFRQAVTGILTNLDLKKEYHDKIHVYGLWANVITKSGGWSQPHIHGDGDVMWSGVYYPKSEGSENINLDEFDRSKLLIASTVVTADGVLVLRDPAKVIKNLTKSRMFDSKLFNGGDIYIHPREGMLILFPASLEHFVTPLINFKEKRYSISFVADIKQ
jgi:uncharacterized protein (TIGR02466 family)